jgi:hypothetical protein
MLDTEQMEAITLIVITFIPAIIISIKMLLFIIENEIKENNNDKC